MSIEDICKLISMNANLKKLNIANVGLLGEGFVQLFTSMHNNCPRLESLTITVPPVSAISSNSPQLLSVRKAAIYGTSSTNLSIVCQLLPNLEVLKIRNVESTHFDCSGINMALQHCSKLTSLNIRRVTVGWNGELSKTNPQLRWVHLDHFMTNFNNWPKFIAQLPNLEIVCVTASNISLQAILKVVKNLKHMKAVFVYRVQDMEAAKYFPSNIRVVELCHPSSLFGKTHLTKEEKQQMKGELPLS